MKDEIISIIAKCACVESCTISTNEKLFEIPEWSSIIYVMVVTCIEEEYQIQLSSDELFDVDTVGDLIDLVKEKCNQ